MLLKNKIHIALRYYSFITFFYKLFYIRIINFKNKKSFILTNSTKFPQKISVFLKERKKETERLIKGINIDIYLNENTVPSFTIDLQP